MPHQNHSCGSTDRVLTPGVLSLDGSRSSSRSSSSSSSCRSNQGGKYRAVVSISSDEDRDRIFHEEAENSVFGDILNNASNTIYCSHSPSPEPGFVQGNLAANRAIIDSTKGARSGAGPPKKSPPPPVAPKKNSKKSAKNEGRVEEEEPVSPVSPGFSGAPALPQVLAHENGAIVNGYLLVNGAENVDLAHVENEASGGKRYHVTGMFAPIPSEKERERKVQVEGTFAGSRDVKDLKHTRDQKIVSAKGTIRGVKNRVRAGIDTFKDHERTTNYRALEKGLIIVYTTSMRIIRETYERCQKVRNILQTHMVLFREADIFMSSENQRELKERLGTDKIIVPQVFLNGQHLGGVEEMESMNESAELRKIFRDFKKVQHMTSCEKCGGYRYVNCPQCYGSKKSLNRNHFTEEFSALRCVNCDENGLVRCDNCNEHEDKKG